MKVEISGIHVVITKDIDDFVNAKIEKVNKYLKGIITSHVILKSEKDRYETEINIITKGLAINAKEVAKDLHASIEGALKKVINQSKKYKEKKKSHKVGEYKKLIQIKEKKDSKKIDKKPIITRITRELAKPMDVDEAVMQLNFSNNNFFIFLNNETNQANVIYKRSNGSFTLIEPS